MQNLNLFPFGKDLCDLYVCIVDVFSNAWNLYDDLSNWYKSWSNSKKLNFDINKIVQKIKPDWYIHIYQPLH